MGRRLMIAAGAAALALAGCGGSSGGGGTPPITDRGATVVVPSGDVARAQLLDIEGNTGTNALFIREGTLSIVLPESSESRVFERVFRSRDGRVVARLTMPPELSSLGFLRVEYAQGGETFVSQSVFGRLTSLSQMPTSGNASFRGERSFAQLRLENGTGGADLEGIPIITADFGAGTVRAALDFRGSAGADAAQIDFVELSGMVISGNRFTGGTLVTTNLGSPVPEFSGPTSSSSGLFGGPNAAEAGGVFIATFPGDRLMTGRYLAPRQ